MPLKPKEAAIRLGISYPTLKQWIYTGKLRSITTPGGHHRIPERELQRFIPKAEISPVRKAGAASAESAGATNWWDACWK